MPTFGYTELTLSDDPLIRVAEVTKLFGRRRALDRVSLDVARGEILGLLGPNGAGKTTLLSLILGLLRPTEGAITVRGVSTTRDPVAARRGVGSVIGPAFYDYLSGWDNLRSLVSYSGLVDESELRDVVRFVGLGDRIHDRVTAYSHGMRRRLALAQALVPAPEVVLLDEPEEGLDPEGIDEMRRLVVRMNRERAVTIVLASHQLAGVERTCDRVAILDRGRFVFDARMGALADGVPRFRVEVDDERAAATILRGIADYDETNGTVSPPAGADVADVVAALVRAGIKVRRVEPLRRSLEEIYLRTVAAAGDERRPGE